MEPTRSTASANLVSAGKYRIGPMLGSGGMGTVHAAEHRVLGERVAVKFLRPEYVRTPTMVARFLREARSLFRISSEHVVRILDVDAPPNGPPFLVMEYVDGQSLETILERRGRLEVHEAVEILRQTCEGLGEAHRLGIVHRDIKPQNVMVTARADGSACVKLVDFGIAHIGAASAATPLATRLTMTKAIIGTPCYMAPEQFRSARDADARSDVWSAGVLLFELLTGDRPWDAASPGDLVFQQYSEKVPLAAFGPGVPEAIAAITMRCFEANPSDRWQSAKELADALSPYARPIAASAFVRVSAGSHVNPQEPRRTPTPRPGFSVCATPNCDVDRAQLTFAREQVRTTHGGIAFERHELVPRGSNRRADSAPTSTIPDSRWRALENVGSSRSPAPAHASAASAKVIDAQTILGLALGVGGIVLALFLLLVITATRGAREQPGAPARAPTPTSTATSVASTTESVAPAAADVATTQPSPASTVAIVLPALAPTPRRAQASRPPQPGALPSLAATPQAHAPIAASASSTSNASRARGAKAASSNQPPGSATHDSSPYANRW